MGFSQQVVVLGGVAHQEFELGFKGGEEVLKGLEGVVLGAARLRAHVPLHVGVASVVEGHLQRRGQVQDDGRPVSHVVPGDAGGATAGHGPVTPGVQGIAAGGQGGDDRAIVVDGRGGPGEQVDLADPRQVGVAVLLFVVAGVDVGLTQAQQLGHLEDDVGHVVDRVFP